MLMKARSTHQLTEAAAFAGLQASMYEKMGGLENLYRALERSKERDSYIDELNYTEEFKAYSRTGRIDAFASTKGMNTRQDTSGGYLLPTTMSPTIMPKGLTGLNPIRFAGATIVDLTQGKGDLYINPREQTQPGGAWVQETDLDSALVTSETVIVAENVIVHILKNVRRVTSKQLDSAAYDPDQFVIQPQLRKFFVLEGTAFVIGTGVGQPEGLFVNGNVSVVHSGSGTTITADSIRNLFYSLPAVFRQNGTWLMNDNTLAVVKELKDSTGAYLYDRGIFGVSPETLLGRPILSCPDAPGIAGGAFPVMFGDLSRYMIVDRVLLAVKADPYSNKPNMEFTFVRRVGGQVVDPNAFVKMLIAT